MSKIQSIQPNYKPNYADFNKNSAGFVQKQSFTGGYDKLAEGAKTILDGSAPKAKGLRKFVNWGANKLDANKGEVQSQLINAFFTTTFAPIFIAFNPFTNQDKKTKEYTALRQPISAAVALAFSFPITKALNEYQSGLASVGLIPSHDLRIAPDLKYLKKQFKNEYKNLKSESEKADFLEKLVPKAEFGADKSNKAYLEACRNKYMSNIQNERKELFSALTSEHPDNISVDEATKTISVVQKDSKTGKDVIKTWKDIPGLGTKAELEAYEEANNVYNVKFGKFMQDEFKFEFFKDGKYKPFTVDQKLSDVKVADFLERLGLVEKGKLDSEELNKILSINYQNSKTVGVIKQSLPLDEKSAQDVVGALAKASTRNTQRLVGENEVKAKNMTLGQFFQHLGIKDGNDVDVVKFQELMNTKISEVLKNMSTIHLKGLKVGEDAATGKAIKIETKTVIDFGKNIMKNKIARAANHFGTLKSYVGLVTNLPIVIVSCTILNWLYPRIVERLFPSLVKDDVKKGGNK